MGTILCVDDRTCALADRIQWLRAHGVAVLVADSMTSALEALLTSPIDAVLLDCHMAGAILVAIQLKRIRPALPVIMLTAYCGLPCRLAGLVTACVGKGESPTALLQKVRSVLEGAAPLCMAA
jgi:CheY-like chemotaxis protein